MWKHNLVNNHKIGNNCIRQTTVQYFILKYDFAAYRIHSSETFRTTVEKVGGYEFEFRGAIQVKVSKFQSFIFKISVKRHQDCTRLHKLNVHVIHYHFSGKRQYEDILVAWERIKHFQV